MVIPIGPMHGFQVLRQVRKRGDKLEWTDHDYVRFVPFNGSAFSEPD